ncbi:MAG TPA: hypothetical protein VIL99_03035 [Ignavibacteria bacterium]
MKFPKEYSVSCFKVSGSLAASESEVLIKGDIPFLALPFRGQIESTIREKAGVEIELAGVEIGLEDEEI